MNGSRSIKWIAAMKRMKGFVIAACLTAVCLLAFGKYPAVAQTAQKGQAERRGEAPAGSAYQTAAEDGAWCWFSDPRAVYYKNRRERIYYGYITSSGDVAVSARDFRTGRTETFILHEKLQVDDHNVPSFLVLDDGRLLAFYTEHNGRYFMRRSKNPEDISAWEEERVLPFGDRATYSHPVMLREENNRIYLFWRGSDWRPSFTYSDDRGETWAEPGAFIAGEGRENSDRPYLKVASDNEGRIDFVFTDGHPAKEALNSVYHMYYEKGAFYRADGQLIGTLEELPVRHPDAGIVYDASVSGARAWVADIALDKKGRPVIAYVRFPSPEDHRYHYARWDGSRWRDTEICRAGGWMPVTPAGGTTREPFYSGGLALDHENTGDVYLSRQVNGVFEIERWSKKRSGWRRRPLTAGSEKANLRPYVVAGDRPGRKAIVLWMQGDYHHYTRFSTVLRINAKNYRSRRAEN